jgi:hypothetical protein
MPCKSMWLVSVGLFLHEMSLTLLAIKQSVSYSMLFRLLSYPIVNDMHFILSNFLLS